MIRRFSAIGVGAMLLAAVAGCGSGQSVTAQQPSASVPSPASSGSATTSQPNPDTLVIRFDYAGGFTDPNTRIASVPPVSVYADGRVLSAAPVLAIYPGPSLVGIQQVTISQDKLDRLVQQGLDAGIAERTDLGVPQVADAPTTVFTLRTLQGVLTRQVPALDVSDANSGLTAEQIRARAKLRAFAEQLQQASALPAQPEDDKAVSSDSTAHRVGEPETPTPSPTTALPDPPGTYHPRELAVIAEDFGPKHKAMSPQSAFPGTDSLPAPPATSWRGPALPGPVLKDTVHCQVVTGDQLATVLAQAKTADMLTRWSDGGKDWALTFRPLLPDEHTCADLLTEPSR